MSNLSNPHRASDSRGLEKRMAFMQLSSETCAAVRSLKTVVERELPVALDKLYAQVRLTAEVSRMFATDDHIGRARGAQTSHWKNIANGEFNDEYAANVRRIGATHARLGLEPRWYIGGYSIILDHLIAAAVREFFPRGRLLSRPAIDADSLARALGGLAKAVFLDMDLAISVYIDEAERAKQEAQAAAIAAERMMVTKVFGAAMAQVAAGNLGYRIDADLPEAYHALRNDFNAAFEQLAGTIEQISTGTAEMNASIRELSMSADDLAQRTQQQASTLEEAVAAVGQISATVSDTGRRACEAGDLVAHEDVDVILEADKGHGRRQPVPVEERDVERLQHRVDEKGRIPDQRRSQEEIGDPGGGNPAPATRAGKGGPPFGQAGHGHALLSCGEAWRAPRRGGALRAVVPGGQDFCFAFQASALACICAAASVGVILPATTPSWTSKKPSINSLVKVWSVGG